MKIALLTCEKLPDLTLSDQLLIPEFIKHSIAAEAVIWDDHTVNWNKFDYLIFRNTWDYFEKETVFNNWLDKIEHLGIKTLNPVALIKENKHKFYLKELEHKGIPVISTLFIDKTPYFDLASLLPQQWQKAVIKPAFSAGSYLTELFDVKDVAAVNQKYKGIASQKELLLQEFIPEIETLGETSFIFYNKKFSHCINKKPATGDFRIQSQFGGKYSPFLPDKDLIDQAQNVVNQINHDALYARVDGIIINSVLQLMEVECIEPDLYFEYGEGSRENFVKEAVKMMN
jgi:glutathione synthase/RimK-type ligase-like ATP-grasp enzyme